jgi:hypothetical protein
MPLSAAFFINFNAKLIVMRKTFLFLFISVFSNIAFTQIEDMNWELDYQVYLKLANDSNYTYDIQEVFHVSNSTITTNSDFIFYPVYPGQEYVDSLKQGTENETQYKTLWGALHNNLGGGWIHFTNCIAYALETRKLDLMAPLMIRPDSKWKPKPMTESFKRTKNWEYFVPVNQKNAQKEYKLRLKEEKIGDLKSLPPSYIELFLNTNQNAYNKLLSEGEFNKLAKIDLVKLILGANYLGEAQIAYISNAVLESIQSYSTNRLPSLIVFDEFDAAAAMSLNSDGYKIERIVFRNSANILESEAVERKIKIEQIIQNINEYNQESFKKRLGNYYSN